MVWMAQSEFGGFSVSKPWLPISPKHLERAVDRQGDENSLLNHYRAAIDLRQTMPALRSGWQTQMSADNGLLTFMRTKDQQTIFCAFNLSEKPASVPLPSGNWLNRAQKIGGLEVSETTTSLPPWKFLVLEYAS